MKADLNKIMAALQQLEQNPNSKSPTFVTPKETPTLETTCEAATNVEVSKSIPPLQPSHKAPILPTFNSSNEEKVLVENSHVEITPPLTPIEELKQVIQQIENLYCEGPIVDGWLESYSCESTPPNDERSVNDANALEYVQAAGDLEKDKVICEAPRSCYRLNGVSKTGQPWSYPCPIEQLPSVSVAIARYEKLLQLIDRKRYLDGFLKQL